MQKDILERFQRYVQVDTQSNDDSDTCPSTSGQLELANMLVTELKTIGMSDVTIDDHGYVMATLPANTDKDCPVIGFLAHVDTATDFTGKGVKPQVIDPYEGGDIVLNQANHIVLSPQDYPALSSYIGHTLITTDGTTLLGGDDKAGVAEIMTAMDYLLKHPDIPHGKIRIAFTPDEEIGKGPHRFDVAAFAADYAYTMDGGPLGELQYESFNAAGAELTFKGNSVHPGTAKDKLVNAAKLAMAFNAQLPEGDAPEHTEGYEGFYHLLAMNGDVEEASLRYIIRDFDSTAFAKRKQRFTDIVKKIPATYGDDAVTLEMKDQYYNMRDKIEPVKDIVDIAEQAMRHLGITANTAPIRGGTDGAQLSYKGLPTPNIFAAGENFHGKFEYISLNNMEKAVQVIVEIAKLTTENKH